MKDPKKDIKNAGNISFEKLFHVLENKKKNKQYLIDNGIHRATIYKFVNNDNVTTAELSKVCYLLDCKIQDIMEYKQMEIE